MAKPLDIDVQLPLDDGHQGWVRFKVHLDDVEDTSQEDQQFILALLDRVNVYLDALIRAGLADAVPDLEGGT